MLDKLMLRLIYSFILLSASLAFGQEKKGVVELESEDIVGYQRRPRIFLEFESHSPTMDSIIFRRDDFDRNQLDDTRLRFRTQVPEGKR